MTLATSASAPSGRPAPRPSRLASAAFCASSRTSNDTLTPVTPGTPPTAAATPVWKWLRTGQPAVVRDTVTSTTPSSLTSIERTMPSSTIERCSSGSMTTSSALRISSLFMRRSILANMGRRAAAARPAEKHQRGDRGRPAGGGRRGSFYCRRDMRPTDLPGTGLSVPGGVSLVVGQTRLRTRSCSLDASSVAGLMRVWTTFSNWAEACSTCAERFLVDAAAAAVEARDGLLEPATALAQLTLEPGAGLAHLALESLAGARAAPLELLQLGLRLGRRGVGRDDVVDARHDAVAGDERRADGDEDGALDDLDWRALAVGRRRRRRALRGRLRRRAGRWSASSWSSCGCECRVAALAVGA